MFLGFGIVASIGVAILFFLLPVVTAPVASSTVNDTLLDKEEGDSAAPVAPGVSFYETITLAITSRPMQLLIPIIFYNGASLGFFMTSFPLIYEVRCAKAMCVVCLPIVV